LSVSAGINSTFVAKFYQLIF